MTFNSINAFKCVNCPPPRLCLLLNNSHIIYFPECLNARCTHDVHSGALLSYTRILGEKVYIYTYKVDTLVYVQSGISGSYFVTLLL